MRCPTCKNDMLVVEHNKVELDYCANCKGVWFDSHELEILLNSMELDSRTLLLSTISNVPEVKSSEKQRKCPICGGKMRKNTVGYQPAIVIDVCRQGDGLWFDGGEVVLLIKQLSTNKKLSDRGSQQQILSFMGEVFKAQE